jgi:hypothetical protein
MFCNALKKDSDILTIRGKLDPIYIITKYLNFSEIKIDKFPTHVLGNELKLKLSRKLIYFFNK